METVNGGIFIGRGGDIRGDVSSVNGGIGLVDTDLGGSIRTVNGDITIGIGSHVKGGIRVEKPNGNWGVRWGKPKVPRIVIGPDAVGKAGVVMPPMISPAPTWTRRCGMTRHRPLGAA